MFCKNYNNFVRPVSPREVNNESCDQKYLSGEEARKLYLEEVSDIKVKYHQPITVNSTTAVKIVNKNDKPNIDNTVNISNKDLFLSVQNNDVSTVKRALDNWPDKINIVDQFGWSLLMIACQANSIETVKELLKRGVNTSIRDKAGHSAQSLVIKNKNYVLADIILTHKPAGNAVEQFCLNKEKRKNINREDFFLCQICSKEYPDRQEHISSTVHNMNASKGRKIPTSYVIPHTNKGYQIMLKTGWDKDTGLGKDGSGNKYPLKTEQKKDRKGLGHEKKKKEISENPIKHKTRKMLAWDNHKKRIMEINFRRQFY